MKTIKFPKLDPKGYTNLYVQKSQKIPETYKAACFRLKKQVVEGIEIPEGTDVWFPNMCSSSVHAPNSPSPYINAPNWKLNEVLKSLVLKSIRGV